MKKIFLYSIISAMIPTIALSPGRAFCNAGDFDMERWNSIIDSVKVKAVEMKISTYTINQVVGQPAFIPAIVVNDKNQSEFKLTLEEYLKRTVNEKRIKTGKKVHKKYPKLLSKVDKKYGVPPNVILAFWGMESNYGEFKARYRLSNAFMTLIYDGRREEFFTNQLLSLMKTADENKIDISEYNGSWAGAMGHFQFIPTTLEKYGVDGDGDKKIDIIHNVNDAMNSAGNYLSQLGWDKKERIVLQVNLPQDFDTSLVDGSVKKPLSEWAKMGITNLDGTPIPTKSNVMAGVILDVSDENAPEAFLTYPNFYRIRKWNSSNWYAIAISKLADNLK